MYQIDKQKFGSFVAQLRKEKGYTQKELAEQLFISDKAVSKWETAVSIPDTALLLSLAELLGVTVTELLLCERTEQNGPLDPGQVDAAVQTALSYPEHAPIRAFQEKEPWGIAYLCCLLLGGIGTLLCWHCQMLSELLLTAELLSAGIGIYFCIFVPKRLPDFYDSHPCAFYCDGALRMHLPGVAFSNSNWPHIIRAGRIWACLSAILSPVLHAGLHLCGIPYLNCAELLLLLVSLFVPLYLAGRNHA